MRSSTFVSIPVSPIRRQSILAFGSCPGPFEPSSHFHALFSLITDLYIFPAQILPVFLMHVNIPSAYYFRWNESNNCAV